MTKALIEGISSYGAKEYKEYYKNVIRSVNVLNRYKIETSLNKKEIEKRIRSKTILKGERIFSYLEDYFFFGGTIENGKFMFYPLPIQMPPRGSQNPFLPKISGEIIELDSSHSIVLIQTRIGPARIGFFALLIFFFAQTNILIFIVTLCFVVFLLKKYWNFVCKRVGEWLEKLLEDDRA